MADVSPTQISSVGGKTVGRHPEGGYLTVSCRRLYASAAQCRLRRAVKSGRHIIVVVV